MFLKCEEILDWLLKSCVEAGLKTFTLALRIVGGYEKGTQCLGV
jgi:hypothetical protein